MPPKKKRQREAVKRQVERWCAGHEEFMQHVEQAMFYALKDGERVTEADVRAILTEHGLELPFPIKDLMRPGETPPRSVRHRGWLRKSGARLRSNRAACRGDCGPADATRW
jgi:hypothetical protein